MAPARVLEALRALARRRHATAEAIGGVPQLQLSAWYAASSPQVRNSSCLTKLPIPQHTWLAQGHGSSIFCRQDCWRPPQWQQPTFDGVAGFATKTRKSSPLSDRYKTQPTNYVQLLQHIHRARKLSHLEELLAGFGDKFDAVHVAAAITVLPKCLKHKLGHGEVLPHEQQMQAAVLLSKLQGMAQEHKGRLFVRQIANMVWALGQCRKVPAVTLPGAPVLVGKPMQHTPTKGRATEGRAMPSSRRSVRALEGVTATAAGLLEDLSDELAAKGYRGCGGRDVAQLLHGMARLRLRHTPALSRLAHFTICHADRFEAKHLALAAWGFARLGCTSPALYDAIAEAAVAQHAYLRPWSASALLGAFARQGIRHSGVCTAACEALAVQVRSFGARELGVVAWALGRLRHRDEALLEALAAHAAQVLESFGPLELGLLLKGLHDAKVVSKVLMDRVAEGIASEAAVVMATADGVRILAAFAALDPHNVTAPAMGEVIAAACARRVHELTLRQASEGVLALAQLGVRHDQLLLKLGAHVAALLGSPQAADSQAAGSQGARSASSEDGDLANVLVGYNRLGCSHPELWGAARTRMEQLIREAEQQGQREKGATAKAPQLSGNAAAREEARAAKAAKAAQAALEHAVDIASELAIANELPVDAGSKLAAALGSRLQAVRPRKLAMALRALSARDDLLQTQPVRDLFANSTAHLLALCEERHVEQGQQQQQQQQASPLVLSACTLALARAGRGVHLAAGDLLLGRWFERAKEQLQEFSEPQAQEIFAAVQLSADMKEADDLGPALLELGHQRGWEGLEGLSASR